MGRLERKYGLEEQNPLKDIYENQRIYRFREISKFEQTYDLLKYVCEQNGTMLEYASKKLVTPELCEIAVKQNGIALQYIPANIFNMVSDKWIMNLYMLAVKSNGTSLEYIPDDYINEQMVLSAVGKKDNKIRYYDRYPIAYVPKKYRTHDVNVMSVSNYPLSIENISFLRKDYIELAELAVEGNGEAIKYVEERFRSKKMYLAALKTYPMAIYFMPKEYITYEICEKCFADDYRTFKFFPSKYITEEMCLYLINNNLFSVLSRRVQIEENFYDIGDDEDDNDVTDDEKYETIDFSQFPNEMRNRTIIDSIINANYINAYELILWNEKVESVNEDTEIEDSHTNARGEIVLPLNKSDISYIRKCIKRIEIENDKRIIPVSVCIDGMSKSYLPRIHQSYIPVEYKGKELLVHDLCEDEYSSRDIYYISDIHLEHQIGEMYNNIVINKSLNNRKSVELLTEIIDQKITELLGDVSYGILLVGGDVSNNVRLTTLFYKRLYKKWRGKIIAVLGNHELWDGAGIEELADQDYYSRNVDEIINDYSEHIEKINKYTWNTRLRMLENEVVIYYKNKQLCKLSYDDIINSTNEELIGLFSKCSLIVLGGVGYSGRDKKYNASTGIYHKTIDLNEDKRRSKIFKGLHDKIAKCAKNKKVIVLTHTPVYDWMPENKCVPNWIYLNGHTHHNTLCRNENGSVILADNQLGYIPKKWSLNAIHVDYYYDIFDGYKDGVYKITSEEYREFYYGKGIPDVECKYPGILYMLKKKENYMFLLETNSSLCLMVGGSRKKLQNSDLDYYYENMDVYAYKIRELIKPYQSAIESISRSIRKIGGTGYIHGCIVDISFFSHVYLNPYDGKVTSYWAESIIGRSVYPDVQSLLIDKEPDMAKKYQLSVNEGEIASLVATSQKNYKVAKVPKWVLGTEIYRESRIMKSLQYVWHQNVIRIWNDDVLTGRKRSTKKLTTSKKTNNSKKKT